MKWYHGLIIGVALSTCVVTGYFIGRLCPQKSPTTPINEKVDTLFVYDTITLYMPKIVERRLIDSVYVPGDTIRRNDTLFVKLPRESEAWTDSLCCVYTTGVDVSVDSIRHYTASQVITRTEIVETPVKPRWSLGVGVYGVATMDGGRIIARPGVGIGIQYNLLSWDLRKGRK